MSKIKIVNNSKGVCVINGLKLTLEAGCSVVLDNVQESVLKEIQAVSFLDVYVEKQENQENEIVKNNEVVSVLRDNAELLEDAEEVEEVEEIEEVEDSVLNDLTNLDDIANMDEAAETSETIETIETSDIFDENLAKINLEDNAPAIELNFLTKTDDHSDLVVHTDLEKTSKGQTSKTSKTAKTVKKGQFVEKSKKTKQDKKERQVKNQKASKQECKEKKSTKTTKAILSDEVEKQDIDTETFKEEASRVVVMGSHGPVETTMKKSNSDGPKFSGDVFF